MAQKKKVSGKASTNKSATPKPKSKSIATKSVETKKTSKSVTTSKSAAKLAKSSAKPVAKQPAKAVKPVAKPAVVAKPAAKPVAKAAPKPVAKPAQKIAPKSVAPVAKASAPVAKAPAPAVKSPASAPAAKAPAPVAKPAVPVAKAPQAKPAPAGVAAAAKGPLPQVKAPTHKPQVAAAAHPAQPRQAAPVAAPALSKPVPHKAGTAAPASPKDIAVRTAEARQQVAAPGPVPPAASAAAATQAAAGAAAGAKKSVSQRHGFKTNEFIVYPAHGVGRIVGIEEQEIAGMSLELFVIQFDKDKMTVRVPTGKLQSVGMRKLADDNVVVKALDTLKGRARVKRTMWSRRAQEYEAKINSGDLISIAEVVRDLYRSESQPEQSYSERQLYEAALDRMAREIAAVEKLDDRGAVQRITEVLSRSARNRRAAGEASVEEPVDADVKAA